MTENQLMNGSKKRIQSKGIRYPMFDLEDAVRIINSVNKGGGTLDLDTLAQAWNCASSTIRHHISSAKHYELIVQEGEIIKNKELAKSICMPISNEEKIQSIQNAFFSCKVYSDLFDRFKGARVPDELMLSNIIHREFKVSATGKGILSKNFIASVKFARLAREQDGQLTIPSGEESIITRTDENYEVPQKVDEQKSLVPKEEVVAGGDQEIHTVNLILSEGRNAKLTIPCNLSKKEAERLKKQIEIFVMED